MTNTQKHLYKVKCHKQVRKREEKKNLHYKTRTPTNSNCPLVIHPLGEQVRDRPCEKHAGFNLASTA